MTTVDAHELDLPEVDILGLDREAAWAEMDAARQQHWLARTAMGFLVMNHDDVTALLGDRRLRSAAGEIAAMAGVEDPDFTGRRQQSILAMDGPDHLRLRRLASPAFTPRAADRLRPFMREVVHGLVDGVSERGRCELVADICEPYPIPIICELLGAPAEDWKLFSEWATDIFRIFNGDVANDLPRIRAASDQLDAYVRSMIADRRSHGDPDRDDLLSDLIAAEEAGDRMTTDELVMMVEAVLMAGTDTTRNQLACSVALLAGNPDLWARLADEPDLAKPVVEETMRLLGAVRGTVRIAAEDLDYRGVRFPAGTVIATSLAGANRDPAAWNHPDEVDPAQPSGGPTQLTFGWGAHFCLGASLARAELQEALPILARRMPGLAIDGEIEWKPPTVGIWGPARLPLRFAPVPA